MFIANKQNFSTITTSQAIKFEKTRNHTYLKGMPMFLQTLLKHLSSCGF